MEEKKSAKDNLIGTIRVPRNLGQITDRLPGKQYEEEDMPKPMHKRMRSTPALDPFEASPAVKEMMKGYVPPSKRNND